MCSDYHPHGPCGATVCWKISDEHGAKVDVLETLAARAQADEDERGWNFLHLGLDVVDGIEHVNQY